MKWLLILLLSCVLLRAQGDKAELDALLRRAQELLSSARYPEAVDPLLKALTSSETIYGIDSPQLVPCLNALASIYYRQRQYDQAEALYSRALAIREKTLGSDPAETAYSLSNLAQVYQRKGQYAKAEPLYVHALEISEKELGPEHLATAMYLKNIAGLYSERGQYAKAEPLYNRALTIREKGLGPFNTLTAESANDLAELYRSQGRFAKAEPLYRRALTITEKAFGPDHPNTATLLANLAYVYLSQGQYAKAEPTLMRALEIRERAHIDIASSLEEIVSFYSSQGLYAKAEPLANRALALIEKEFGPDHPYTAVALDSQASLNYIQHEYAKAEPKYTRALAIREKTLGPDHPETAASLNHLALIFSTEGQYAKAEPLTVRALAINEKTLGRDSLNTAESLNLLGALSRARGQYAKAEILYTRAFEITEKVLGPDHPDTAKSIDYLATFLAEQGQLGRSRELLISNWPHRLSWLDTALRSGRESFRESWIADLKKQFSFLVALQEDSAPLKELGLEAVLNTKNRVSEEIGDALSSLRGRVDDESGHQLDSLEDIWLRQRHLWSTHSANADSWKPLKDEEDRLIAEISARSLEFQELTKTPSLNDIRSRLGAAALVELIQFNQASLPRLNNQQLGRTHYGAYLLRAGGEIGWLDLGTAEAIDKLVHRYRFAAITPGNEVTARKAAKALEQLVFEPIRKALPDVREFYISPDGRLHLVPYAALLDENAQPLLKRFTVHTLATGRDLVIGDPLAPAQSPIISGIEEFGEETVGRTVFPSISGAKSEADTVSKMIPSGQRVAADRMTRTFLLDRVNAPRILHLATHGFYLPDEPGNDTDPLTRSGIALSKANESDEGILTAKDASMLRLRGTQLVVLSACETGVGEATFADGVVGLQRSLKLAGARSEILTLWPVSDEKTRDLMVLFYQNLFEKKLTKSEALRQAQITMADQGIDAYYWAPFVLYGDPGPLR